ncbi:hypothetical protein SAMN05660209_03071 [Geodermatophilus africanus]|uniref:Uncharacterized protein n=1 Tax=Geodermatophilus africanus TaxID=1137993 RepID=A0A1H3KNF1_9ACTN|nr:hypothetical protein [Geodermatophilus africanus]SDY53566.1 hypothetical protein SAMN05660209_03071 [Geodermatophilus africanus]
MEGHWPYGEPDDELHRRIEPPENEIPVALPQNVLLARTDDVAVALLDLHVLSTGVSFHLTVRARAAALRRVDHRLTELVWNHGPRGGRFLLGVEFSDGRRGSSLPMGSSEGVLLHSRGGGGGETSVDQRWWLSPLPPEGPVRVVVRCPELGIEETSAELDGTAIRRAAEQVVELWPWEPEPPHREPPPPPDLPDDSWFARR